jgi:hypothetical protein
VEEKQVVFGIVGFSVLCKGLDAFELMETSQGSFCQPLRKLSSVISPVLRRNPQNWGNGYSMQPRGEKERG